MAVDYEARLRYLISREGSQRALFRSEQKRRGAKLKRATMYRILKGGKPSKKTRDLINRRYREKAPAAVKKREKAGKGIGFALVDQDKAKQLERSYAAEGKEFKVVAHSEYDRQIGGIGRPETETEWGRGTSVDEADQQLEGNFRRLKRNYPQWNIKTSSRPKYRVYLT